MDLLFLPFRTTRSGPVHGCVSRQFPCHLAARYHDAGVRAQCEPIFARRGPAVAHTVMELEYPERFIGERCEHFDAVVTGWSSIDEETLILTASVSIWTASARRPSSSERITGEIEDVVDQAAAFISEKLHLPPLTPEQSSSTELLETFFRRDKESLEAEPFQAQTKGGAS